MRCESRISLRLLAGILSVALHVGLILLIASSSGRFEGLDAGETPITQLVLIESRQATRRDGDNPPSKPPVAPALASPLPLNAEHDELPLPAIDSDIQSAEPDGALVAIPAALAATETPTIAIVDPAADFTLPTPQRAALMQRLAKLAEEVSTTSAHQVAWQEDGRQYRVELQLQPASNGVDFDHVVAEVSAEEHGQRFETHIRLKRLAFSHYTQIVDRWDPTVQLHDDEIVGRFHVNSQFNLLYDRQTTPRFLGKVTTAASSFSTQAAGRRRIADIFRGGIETNAERIDMPQSPQPFEWAPRDADARIHEFAHDTHIRFFADGSYAWRDDAGDEQREATSGTPVYFIATDDATLYVRGVVAGRVLVYSPHKVVVEDSLTYAHDPRDAADAADYLGLVSDRTVEIAAPHVTGPGDLDIHAAIFAGRRFVVRDIDQPRTATLRIFGSLAAGSLSASEPRYATKVEYDSRFEHQRPPGFPSTSRFAAEDWDGRWDSTTEPVSAGTP